MPITFVGKAEQNNTGDVNPRTFTFDIGTRTNGLLLVDVAETANASFTVSSATYGGQAMTIDKQQNRTAAAPFHTVAKLSLKNPPNGSNQLSITFNSLNGTSAVSIFASWYDGANQTPGADQTNGGTGSTDPSLAVTPTEDGELVNSVQMSEANDLLTPAQTLIHDHDLGVRVAGASYIIQTTAQPQTMSWAGADDEWTMAVASYKAFVAPPTTLPPTTLPPTTLPPTTLAPTTLPPTTLAPTTLAPTTPAPTTLAPTTPAPTTLPPTTLAPTTPAPTTLAPTTLAPTTSAPTTLPPTTLAPTTLPPTTVGPTTEPPCYNDVSDDPNAVALYRFESGALTVDSKDANDLTASASPPTENTTDFWEGACAADFELGSSQHYRRNNVGLSSNFPFKSGTTNKIHTVLMAFRSESNLSVGENRYLICKADAGNGTVSWGLLWQNVGGVVRLAYVHGYSGGGSWETIVLFTFTPVLDRWYHLAFSYDDATKAWYAKIWDDITETAQENSGTTVNNIALTAAPFLIACIHSNTNPVFFWDGEIDEVLIFDKVLTENEIDRVRQGLYGCVTTAPPTTLPPTTLAPTTPAPTTLPPTTLPPTTVIPTTPSPTTLPLTTPAPTTPVPTTLPPTTLLPTTSGPTTAPPLEICELELISAIPIELLLFSPITKEIDLGLCR